MKLKSKDLHLNKCMNKKDFRMPKTIGNNYNKNTKQISRKIILFLILIMKKKIKIQKNYINFSIKISEKNSLKKKKIYNILEPLELMVK
jgi:hypothetical protein